MQYKKYLVKGFVEWQASIKVGEAVFHIPFSGGGYNGYSQNDAFFITGDPVIQNVIESSEYFGNGKRITLDKRYTHGEPEPYASAKVADKPMVQTMSAPVNESPEGTADEAPKELKEVEVACLDDAKEYLKTNFNANGNRMRSAQSIQAVAAENGIKFVGEDFK